MHDETAKSRFLSIFPLILVSDRAMLSGKGIPMVPTEIFVRDVLSPHESAICRIIEESWAKVCGLPDRHAYDLKRTIAVLMHQFTMNAVREEFTGNRDIRLIERDETIRLLVGRSLVVRLKKMDQRGYTRAIPTQATMAFTNEVPLPWANGDLPDIHTVDFGYVLNELETKIDTILVAARYGESVVWSYVPDRGAASAVAGTIQPPAPPARSADIIKLPTSQIDRKDDGKQ